MIELYVGLDFIIMNVHKELIALLGAEKLAFRASAVKPFEQFVALDCIAGFHATIMRSRSESTQLR